MMIRMMFILLLVASSGVKATVLEALVVNDDARKTSVTCTLSGNFSPKTFVLTHPNRVVIDFPNTTTVLPMHSASFKKGLVVGVRGGYQRQRGLRLVLEVTRPVTVNTVRWHSRHSSKQGLRIDLLKGAPLTHQPTISTKKAVKVVSLPSHRLRDVVVVLDPGHGGKDPGAIGPRRMAEKNVVLAMAYKLKQKIDKQPGMHAVLTRKGDYYVGLRERLNIARRYNADIFISIHADAYINAHSNGASVFALSQTGATSEAARWLAEKENYSELGGVNLSHLNDRNGVIRTVLLDLSQTATISASVQMGTEMLHHLDKVTNLHNNVVEQARFVVLKSPDIPSVLVETGFISNPREEKNLSNPGYQERVTGAIFAGVTRYFWDHPPHGTRLEALNSGSLHVVRAGEGWGEVAARYQTSVAVLKMANHGLEQDLFPGQKIIIPPSWA